MKIQSADQWRECIRTESESGRNAIVSFHAPESLREFLMEFGAETDDSLSGVTRWIVQAFAMAITSPNLRARRQFLQALLELQTTTVDSDDAVDWFDDTPEVTRELTRELEYAVRLGDSEAALAQRLALLARIRGQGQAGSADLREAVREVLRELKAAGEL